MRTLVLLRHGQSQWNLENRFTGWWDVDLSDLGIQEARGAGRLMCDKGLNFDACFWAFLFTDARSRARKQRHYGSFQFYCKTKQK